MDTALMALIICGVLVAHAYPDEWHGYALMIIPLVIALITDSSRAY